MFNVARLPVRSSKPTSAPLCSPWMLPLQSPDSGWTLPEPLVRQQPVGARGALMRQQPAGAEEEALQQALAQEKEQYAAERQRLDDQLADRQQQVHAQQQELQHLQQADVPADISQQRHILHRQRVPQAGAEPRQPGGERSTRPPSLDLGGSRREQKWAGNHMTPRPADHRAAENAALRLSSLGTSPATSSLAPSSASTAAPSQRFVTQLHGGDSADRLHAPPQPSGMPWKTSASSAAAPWGSLGGGVSRPSAATAGPLRPPLPDLAASRPGSLGHAAPAEDPLAKARQQVQQAKEYLRHAAEWGSKLSQHG